MERMRWLEGEHHESDDPVTWVPMLWTLTVVLGGVFAATLALPALPGYADGPLTSREYFHPEWLVTASLLVLPLYRAARSSWRAALLVVPIASVQVLYIADTAVRSLHQAGLANPLFVGWYAVAFAQIAAFVTVGVIGAKRDLVDRRWVKMMKRVTALPPPDRRNTNRPTNSPRHPDPPSRPGNGFAA
jgi:hypothetical protein